MHIMLSKEVVTEAAEASKAYNSGLLTLHQFEILLQFLGAAHLYELCPITNAALNTFKLYED